MIGAGREELEESYLGEIALDEPARTRRSCWRPQGLTLGAVLPRRLVRGARGRGARHLRLHGLRPDRTGAHAVRQAAARRAASLQDRRRRVPARQHDRRPRRAGIGYRAGKPARDAVPRGAGLQEHLDRHPRAHFALAAQAGARARDRRRCMCSGSASARPTSRRGSARCRAATSRRSRWPNG